MIARAIWPRALGALIIFIVVIGLARCAPVQPPARPSAGSGATTVLLVSLDGFRADYLDRGLTPAMSRIAREGVRAEWMSPSYPSLTFPNHYTIVTGLRPDHTGVVHNTMRDAQLGGFSMSNPSAVTNASWWGGEPVWVTCGEGRTTDGDPLLARQRGGDSRRASASLSTFRRADDGKRARRRSNRVAA